MPTRYLDPRVAFEPLVCRWHASIFMLAPATLAMVARNRLFPLIESFVADPAMHHEAAHDPRTRGGMFIDFDGSPELATEQLQRMQAALAPQLELAEALGQVNDLLILNARGGSLEALYPRLPESLRGLVELGYDLNNHPSLRLIEALLYHTPFYDQRLQSVYLRRIGDKPRPFILTTPLFDESAGLLLDLPFCAPEIDSLAMARTRGLSDEEFNALQARLAERGADAGGIDACFTTEPPPRPYTPPPRDSMRVRYFGHATLLIECGGVAVMTDPTIGYEAGGDVDHYSFADLPERIDFVLITHNHQDHVLLEFLLQLRHRIGTIVVPRSNGGFVQDPSIRLALQNAGFRSILELDEMGSVELANGAITALPFLGEHGDLHIRSKLAYHIRMGKRRLVCLADSNNLDPALYERVAARVAAPDLVFIGMECVGAPMSWLYGDLLPQRLLHEHDESRRLDGSDFERARRIVDAFKPKGVYVYALGAEPWYSHILNIDYDAESAQIVESDRLIDYCLQRGIASERLFGKREFVLGAADTDADASTMPIDSQHRDQDAE